MEDVPRNGVLEALRGRLGWSAGIREHLVEVSPGRGFGIRLGRVLMES